jgi:Lrp/AsnC family leucine-responsive transcriptional regulator
VTRNIQLQSEIDELDNAILAALDLNCRISSVELAQNLNRSRQTIDYRIERLLSRGIIENFHTTVNYSRMGFRKFKILLRLRNLSDRKLEFREFILSLGNVYWIGECSGAWDLLLGLFYKDEIELASITNKFVSKFDDLIVARSGHTMISIDQFPKKYFTNTIHPSKELLGLVKQNSLDEHDYSLLAELIQNARITFVQLSEILGVSIASVQRRMKRLEELGVIVQYRIGVNLEKMDFKLYKVIFELWRYGEEDHTEFFKYINTRPEIQYAVRNIWSLELEIVVRSYAEIQAIIDEIRIKFPRLSLSIDTLLLESDEWTSALKNLIKSKGLYP